MTDPTALLAVLAVIGVAALAGSAAAARHALRLWRDDDRDLDALEVSRDRRDAYQRIADGYRAHRADRPGPTDT